MSFIDLLDCVGMITFFLSYLAVKVSIKLGNVLVVLPAQIFHLLGMLSLQSLYFFTCGSTHRCSQSCDFILMSYVDRFYFLIMF